MPWGRPGVPASTEMGGNRWKVPCWQGKDLAVGQRFRFSLLPPGEGARRADEGMDYQIEGQVPWIGILPPSSGASRHLLPVGEGNSLPPCRVERRPKRLKPPLLDRLAHARHQ